MDEMTALRNQVYQLKKQLWVEHTYHCKNGVHTACQHIAWDEYLARQAANQTDPPKAF